MRPRRRDTESRYGDTVRSGRRRRIRKLRRVAIGLAALLASVVIAPLIVGRNRMHRAGETRMRCELEHRVAQTNRACHSCGAYNPMTG